MSDPRPLPHRDVFEKHGETGTRFLFAGKPGEIGRSADAWLAEMQAQRDAECSTRRDAREEETLSIAKEANRIASEARTAAFEQARWAKWAAIIATVAAIIAVAFSK